MSWNYRLTKEIIHNKYVAEPEILYGIREVFYDENGDISGFSEEPDVVSDSVDGMKDILTKMLMSCDKPLIDYNTGEEIQDRN
jgi:hypothetical protein